jgi:hypothetical protein
MKTMRPRGYITAVTDLIVLTVGLALFGLPFALVLFSPFVMGL